MSIVIAVRHGRSTANTAGVLAGRTAGVELDETGIEQARELGRRLEGVELAAVVTSPVQRCRQTVEHLLEAAGRDLAPHLDNRLVESDYGDWQGRALKDLADDPLWEVVQKAPSQARFPNGESMLEVQERVVDAVLDWNSRLPDTSVWLLASHGDPLAALVNWAVGAPFDNVQRIGLDPGSATVIALPSNPASHDTGAGGGEDSDLARPPRVLTVNSPEGLLSRWTAPAAPQVGGSRG
ncbi:MSMEG_4193 family putative phosphomutase [Aestuariimicrobium sp. p3-SID1156]|uniref:MSMEG_4193 family putative phosphomutase n=1 Tax=Aestuariimicrobium sp. p3-SID1156 TaxID=2916038 RepID=UPI00223B8E0A|nr:MSMEG_4193 family putative phosphomutase [Aestuariimicrobium sp. p3-SID1156]MCT1460336.1 MSMEG_4193 family putative phosphomutase [Aestuariimicrobium sp. p3-SID1156]